MAYEVSDIFWSVFHWFKGYGARFGGRTRSLVSLWMIFGSKDTVKLLYLVFREAGKGVCCVKECRWCDSGRRVSLWVLWTRDLLQRVVVTPSTFDFRFKTFQNYSLYSTD